MTIKPMAAEALGLGHHRAHVPRREELPLLEVDRRAGPRRRRYQVGLAREQRRNLQHVGDLGHRRRLRGLMDVGQHRESGFALDPLEHAQALLQAGPAKRSLAGAIGFVERRFENDRNAARARNRGQPLGVAQTGLGAFDHARPRDQHEARAAENHRARRYLPFAHDTALSARTLAERSGAVSARRTTAARMSPRNSGWQSHGRERNSGWNWQPRNHGWPGSSMISTS